MDGMSSVSLRGVAKSFPNGVVALHPTDLDVSDGDRLALLGPSGSGKSTLLRLIAGLDEPDCGDILIAGERVNAEPPHRRGVAFVPQRPVLYPHLTVRENLEVPSRLASRERQRPEKAPPVADAPGTPEGSAELLRVAHLFDRYPHQLSGGERQRVALARAAVRRPRVWLLDEPFAPLDPVFRTEFRHDLHLLLKGLGATMLMVTHDPIDALALGRRVGVLGDGRLRQLGTPEELRHRPGNRFVAEALGRFVLVPGRVGGGDPSGASFASEDGSVVLPLPAKLAGQVAAGPTPSLTLGIRPEDVTPRSPGDRPDRGAVLTGWTVVLAEPVGSGWVITAASGRTRVRAAWPAGSPPPVGAPTDWYLPADRCVWFDGTTGARIGDV
jgi:ABC-type sugar transport system ATPase subunit